tara:strand:+ start:172 stop:387 length:216 start_codon:yes stop_codon:yes gene_type:complete
MKIKSMFSYKSQIIYISPAMDEFEALQKRVRFGQRALLIAVAVLLGLLLITGNFIGKTDKNCAKYNNCQER